MLIADPSSQCDVCYSTFGPETECYCIPCGHVFCQPCLLRLPYNRLVCPICRTHLNSRSRIRKIIVDWSGRPSTIGDGDRPTHVSLERELEEQLAQEAERGTSLPRALRLQQKVQDYVKHWPEEKHMVLKSFASVISDLYQTKDQLADLKKRKEELELQAQHLAQRERDLKMEIELAADANRRNETILQYLVEEVASQKEIIKELRNSPQESFHPPPQHATRSDSSVGQQCRHNTCSDSDEVHLAGGPPRSHDPCEPHKPDFRLFTTAFTSYTAPHLPVTPPHTPHNIPRSRKAACNPEIPSLPPSDYPPPPPMATVHAPEVGINDIWPYEPTPRLREKTPRAAEERAARPRTKPHPTLSYDTIYQGHMQSRTTGYVPFPGKGQLPPPFYEMRMANTHETKGFIPGPHLYTYN